MNYTAASLVIGITLLAITVSIAVNAPHYMCIAQVSLSTIEASLRHATLNALIAHLCGKSVKTALRENIEALDPRYVPLSRYRVVECHPVDVSTPWPKALLKVEYWIALGDKAQAYNCTVKLEGYVTSTSSEGLYDVVSIEVYDERGLILSPELLSFNPKPLTVKVEDGKLKLYYPRGLRPSTIEITDTRGLRIYLST